MSSSPPSNDDDDDDDDDDTILKNDDNNNNNRKSFPFTTIIVTNPDEASAKAAQQLLEDTFHHLNHPRRNSNNNNNNNNKKVRLLSTYDPFGARCGSFGGTLAAIDLLESDDDNDDSLLLQDETILCLHAGGDSSRCPLSMILGKAWQELPSQQYRNPTVWLLHQLEALYHSIPCPPSTTTTTAGGGGSLWVAATDCLISLGQGQQPTHDVCNNKNKNYNIHTTSSPTTIAPLDPSTVVGVAVPAPLQTAKNHGVYVLPPQSVLPSHHHESCSVLIEDPLDVWQKPTVDQLQGTYHDHPVSFHLTPHTKDKQQQDRQQQYAWIDVGIVVFYPQAFQTLRRLSKTLLAKCTRRGLEAAYHHQQECEYEHRATTKAAAEEEEEVHHDDQSLTTFAKQNAIKVDLYTDILHNLPWANKEEKQQQQDNNDIRCCNSDPKHWSRQSLKHILSALSLKVLVLPQGSFLHLGTTQELLEFVTCGAAAAVAAANVPKPTYTIKADNDDDDDNDDQVAPTLDRCVTRSLAKSLNLQTRLHSFPEPPLHGDDHHSKNVTLRSTFPNHVRLGTSTLVECSDLDFYDDVRIGSHCMLSGWRCPKSSRDDADDHDHEQQQQQQQIDSRGLTIPDAVSVQLLSTSSSILRCEAVKKIDTGNTNDEDDSDTFVVMALGTCDSVKAPILQSTLFGIPLEEFLEQTNVTLEQLGMQEPLDGNDCLWTAKIHPVVRAEDVTSSFSHYFGWIDKGRAKDESLRNDSSFSRWLCAKRVSLKELHHLADAGKEWQYRRELERKIWRLQIDKEISHIEDLLLRRQCSVPCELGWLVNMKDKSLAYTALCTLVLRLERLAAKSLREKTFDISGRAFMLASSVLAELQERSKTTQSSDASATNYLATLFDRLKRSSCRSFSADRTCPMVDEILKKRREIMQPSTLEQSSEILEKLAQRMTELAVFAGFQKFLDPNKTDCIKFVRKGETNWNEWLMAVAPARVDLAGGWSDTPPICYEYGGSVTGMAVLVDDYYPLSCRCRLVPGKRGILLHSDMRDLASGSLLSRQQCEVSTMANMLGFREPSSSCALIKAALVCLGMVTENHVCESEDLQALLNSFCGSVEDLRLEIVTTSLLGLGTGMGTSSILGACVLQSIAESVGIGKLSDECICHSVLMLEQILSSGGGWQDQTHGILPGIKTVRSLPPRLPLQVTVDPIELPLDKITAFENRLMFAYTGQTRLAKNILQQVLRRWSRRTPEIVQTVRSLVEHSESVRQALLKEDWDDLAAVMYSAYRLKCVMAGKNSGAEPKAIQIFISQLMEVGLIQGAMLCGAGGGGFLMLVRSHCVTEQEIKDYFAKDIAPSCPDFETFTWHACSIARRGVSIGTLDKGSAVTVDTFDLSWHR